GILNIQNSAGLGSSSSFGTVSNGAILQLQNGITVSNPLTLMGSGAGGIGALSNNSGSNTYSGTITLSGQNVAIGAIAGPLALPNPISGSSGLTISGSTGKVALKAANTYTG